MSSKILCVDDDIAVMRVMRQCLVKRGYHVLTATTVLDALQIARNEDLDLIILDILLPDVDGYGFFEMLAAERRNRNVPIIVVSGCSSDDARRLASECGAVAYVRKPFQVKQFLAIVDWAVDAPLSPNLAPLS